MLDDDEKTGKLSIICDVPVGDSFCKERIDFDTVYDIDAPLEESEKIMNDCQRAALAAGWGEHIYPGEGSVLDGKRITYGVNDLCPKHLDWKKNTPVS